MRQGLLHLLQVLQCLSTYLCKLTRLFHEQVVSEEAARTLVVGDEEVFPGFDVALKSMKDKEEATFSFKPKHAFGSAGSSELKVPADAVVKATVKVSHWA